MRSRHQSFIDSVFMLLLSIAVAFVLGFCFTRAFSGFAPRWLINFAANTGGCVTWSLLSRRNRRHR